MFLDIYADVFCIFTYSRLVLVTEVSNHCQYKEKISRDVNHLINYIRLL